jgi:hypothetical protein
VIVEVEVVAVVAGRGSVGAEMTQEVPAYGRG